jgi:hypothetical protein
MGPKRRFQSRVPRRSTSRAWALATAWFATLALGCTTPEPQPPAVGADAADPLLMSLQVRPTATQVNFLIQVTNTTTGPIDLNFSSGQSFDVMVRQGTRDVWTWSADKSFLQALRMEQLAPGQSQQYEAMWQPAPNLRGEFEATGRFVATNHRLEQTTRFTLP